MSRHRNVRNLDYEEILEDDSGAGEMSPEDAEKLDRAVDEIISIIGNDFSIADIKDAAWHYYFDVEQSTNYLLDQRARQQEKERSSLARKAENKGMPITNSEENPSSTATSDRLPQADATTKTASSISTTHPHAESKGIASEKPLSKIQQLARSKAAAKKMAGTTNKLSSSDRLTSSLSRLRVAPLVHDASTKPDTSAITTQAPRDEVESAKDKKRDEPHIAESQYDVDIRQVLSEIELAKPSDFAVVVLDSSKKTIQTMEKSFSEPSPDDVVLRAQSASKGLIKGKVSNGNINQTIPETPSDTPIKTKSNAPRRGREITDNAHQRLSLVVVGHVDAGKSTLFGRLLYDLGDIDERSMQKLRKESEKLNKSSFAFAWAMDSSVEERERGVTMDIASSNFTVKNTTFTILDAPGHRDFVPNMIAGAAQADFAILVVDASKGEFESGFDADGQTKEHAILIRALGIQKLIVAINKMDNVDWAQDRYKDIKVQLTTFLTHTGFSEAMLSFIPCSGLSGEGVVKRTTLQSAKWYTSNSLVEEMQTAEVTVQDETSPFRMMISDIQSTPNSSSITVLGRLSSGELQADDTVICMPSKETATIRSLNREDASEVAFARDSVTLTLSGIDPMYLRIGDVLCHPQSLPSNRSHFKTQMVTFQLSRPLLTGSSVVLHRGRADMPAILRKIEKQDKKAGVTKATRHVLGNSQAIITLELVHGVIPLEIFSANKDLGRIILRREGSTVAAGVVIELL